MSMNCVFLVGTVLKEPNVRRFDNGTTSAEFVMITGFRGYTKPDGTKVEERKDFHHVAVRTTKMAESVAKYLHKGETVAVRGELRYRQYTDSEGMDRRLAEVVAERVDFLGTRAHSDSAASQTAAAAASPRQEPVMGGDNDDLPW